MNKEDVRKEARDNFTIVLEALRSDFKIFGEVLAGVNSKIDRVEKKGDVTFEEVGKIKIDVSEMKEDIVVLKSDVSEIKEDIVVLKSDVSEIKEDIVVLKSDVSEVKGEVKEINIRFENIENEVKSLRKDFNLAKEDLEEKIDAEYIKQFDQRLTAVEKHLKLT